MIANRRLWRSLFVPSIGIVLCFATPAEGAALDRLRALGDANIPDSPELGEREANANVIPKIYSVGFQDADDGENCEPRQARYGLKQVSGQSTECASGAHRCSSAL